MNIVNIPPNYYEHKFKVGDRVKRVTPDITKELVQGGVYVVSGLTYELSTIPSIKLEGISGVFSERYFVAAPVCLCAVCGADLNQFKTDTGYTLVTGLKGRDGSVIDMCLDCFKTVIGA